MPGHQPPDRPVERPVDLVFATPVPPGRRLPLIPTEAITQATRDFHQVFDAVSTALLATAALNCVLADRYERAQQYLAEIPTDRLSAVIEAAAMLGDLATLAADQTKED